MIKTINFENKIITIIGTAHISRKSADTAREIILNLKPDVVAVELDQKRFYSLMSDPKEKREVKFSDIFKASNPASFLIGYILGKYQKQIADQFNITPGEEMKSAVLAAKEVNAKILLIDRDIDITLSRLNSALKFKDRWNLFLDLFFRRKQIDKEFKNVNLEKLLKDVENNKLDESELINKIMIVFEKRYKKIKTVLIDERDLYMCYQLQTVPFENIVLVVGAGHLKGITKQIENRELNISKIISRKFK
ncbi:MAG: TraB domain-containing protein [archaeon]